MTPAPLAELRTCVAVLAVLLVPGWAMLVAHRSWRELPALQAWAVATCLGVAFYPLLFAALRVAAPGLALGPASLAGLLAALALVVAWRLRRDLRRPFALSRLEAAALAAIAATLATRWWVAHLEPFPAWSDSLHHVLLTDLTVAEGRLPASLLPYFAIPLARYHLGLYALAAPVAWLSGVPAHTALLWTAQTLSGLCALGVYLVLDRHVGRLAAVLGAVAVGLISHQPAFYVNWGRFTQLSAQTILLAGWVFGWEVLRGVAAARGVRAATGLAPRALWASLLCGAVFLLHLRVAVFLVALYGVSFALELWSVRRDRAARRALLAAAAGLAVAALVLAGPAVLRAALEHARGEWAAWAFRGSLVAGAGDRLSGDPEYFRFSPESVGYLFAPPATLVLIVALALVGIARRNPVACIFSAWAVLLVALGEVHRLGIPALNLTNAGAVLIMLYLPAAVLVATGVHELLLVVRAGRALRAAALALFAVLGALGARDRVSQLEPYRFFVTPADLRAMRWIEDNTPPRSLFAVRTTFWMPGFPHGVDAGYWIPYLAGRRTTVGPMIAHLSPRLANQTRYLSRLLEEALADDARFAELWKKGVRYLYIGARAANGADEALRLAASPSLALRYAEGDVFIFEVDPIAEGQGRGDG